MPESLSPEDKKIIRMIQGDLPVSPTPFAALARRSGMDEQAFLKRVRRFIRRGTIRRFGAILRHQIAGYRGNAMAVWSVPEEEIGRVSRTMASFPAVSHCYLRPEHPRWPYNLYTMIHGKNPEDCRRTAKRMARETGITQYRLLFSKREHKKSSMNYFGSYSGAPERSTPATKIIMNQGGRPMKPKKSQKLFQEAQKVIPGGVNSPVRAFRSVGLEPLFVSRAQGAKVYDADGRVYIDFMGSWGPMILGHAHPRVRKAMTQALAKGWSYGAATELEVRLAQKISKAIPSMEMIRMVSSGTEAAMSALRVARGFTGRDKVIKFEGCYHGHADSFLVKAGSGAMTYGIPDSAGVPASLAEHTLVAPYNDLPAVRDLFERNPSQIAGVVVEPIAGNMGVVLPKEGFLKGLESLCRENDALLIFDEVITGFRLAFGGVQNMYGVKPDLTCLGKIIGGGMPVGAYGGRREIMGKIAPLGSVYQAGTLSGNPLAMTCGLATLEVLRGKGIHRNIERLTVQLCGGLEEICRKKGIPARINRAGSMFTLFFTGEDVFDYATAKKADTAKYARYFAGMVENGVWLPPSQFEACFLSLAHTEKDVDKTLKAAENALEKT